ncbi:hypothetical protein MRX96_025195 [Rhipicephalus microplus]
MRDDDYGEESEYSSGSSSEVSSAPRRKSGSSSVLGWSGSPAPGSVFAVVSTAVVLLCSGALLYLYVNWSNDRMGQQQLAAATKRAPAAAASGRRRRASDALLVARTERALLEALRARPPPLLGLCWKGATRTGLRQLRELLEDVGLAGWPYRNNRDHVDAWRVAATLTRDLGLDALLAVELLQVSHRFCLLHNMCVRRVL